MRKQTKLVAVLSTAALLAIGASMTSFAATGWAEEDGTWVYYNRDGERATDQWKKSGNNWYYLDSDGEMAIDTLIEDGDNYYYVDINGVMAANQWVAIENEDAGEDDEPDHYWYYFQANGKALTNGNNDKVSLKTINGKKYAFDEEGKMLFGWVDSESAERIDDTDGEGFKDGDYYFGGSDDGAMTVGWLQIDITYDEATEDDYKYTAAAFNDDEDQTRWFYFKSNGKKVFAENGDRTKDKTINGRKYAFDQHGAMVAEWSLDEGDLGSTVASYNSRKPIKKVGNTVYVASRNDVIEGKVADSKYSQAWKFFNSVEDGARVSKGWFKVVPAEYLNDEKYDDDESFWYYADGSGNIYAGEFKTIKGKKYAFRDDGRMIDGLHFIYNEKINYVDNTTYDGLDVKADDDAALPFDDEDAFLESAIAYEQAGYKSYYFGGSDDGAMRTGKTTVEIDGENHNFYFEKSGSSKGAGVTGEKDDKLYMSGMLMKADSDDKYQIVKETSIKATKGSSTQKTLYYEKIDVEDFCADVLTEVDVTSDSGSIEFASGATKKNKDLKEAYVPKNGAKTTTTVVNGTVGDWKTVTTTKYLLVNTSGKVIDTNSKSKDGNDYYILTSKSTGGVIGVYVED